MSVQSDKWIKKMAKEYSMISPFEDKQIRGNKISFGVSSYGYDARVSSEFKIGRIGRFLRLSSPVNIVLPPDSAAIAIAILIVVPEFSALIIEPETVEPIVFLIVIISSSS